MTKFLFAIQGLGGIFVGIFLIAYLAGLPSTNVLHSNLYFRTLLAIFGTVFLTMTIAAVGLAALSKRN